LAQISAEFIKLVEPLAEKKACEQVAEIAVKMLR
jgi:hypothetical protein